jgi:Ca2+-binding RTX toxin-like protein
MRKAVIVFGSALLMLVVAGGVAWAANVIQCPNDPDGLPECYDTPKNDIMYGSGQRDVMLSGWGADVVYGYKGDDEFEGDKGADVYYGGSRERSLRSRLRR